MRARAPTESRVCGCFREDAGDPPELLPSPGTERAEHTRGLQTNPETTEGDPGGTATTVRGYRSAPAPVGDRADDRGRRGARDGAHRERSGGAVAGVGQGRSRPRGGVGGHLRVVLGGGSARGR